MCEHPSSYMFVSDQLAKLHPTLFESGIVASVDLKWFEAEHNIKQRDEWQWPGFEAQPLPQSNSRPAVPRMKLSRVHPATDIEKATPIPGDGDEDEHDDLFSVFFFGAQERNPPKYLPHGDGDNLLPNEDYANVAHPFLFGYGDDNRRKMTMRDYSKFNPHPDVDDEDVDHAFMFAYSDDTRKRLRRRRERKIPVTNLGKL